MKTSRVAVLCCFAAFALPAFATPNDDVAIIRHCGHPLQDKREVSQASGKWQRDLYYDNDVVFHFQPVGGGWDLTSAWDRHIPLSREGLAAKFPCVRDALAEAAGAKDSVADRMDPTIAVQTRVPREGGTFGIPQLWLILLLGVTVVLAVLLPNRRRRPPANRLEPRTLSRQPDYERHSSASHRKVE
ncbi:MAG TPA: hypothetical protein VGN16_06840 [Acidobacteriaceae bacterium]